VRTGSSGSGIVTVARYNLHPRFAQRATRPEPSPISNLRAVPFTDFGNRYALTGSSFDPTVLEHETWSQIAAELRNPRGIRGLSILGAVNYITAAICRLTGDQPATACTPLVRSLLPS